MRKFRILVFSMFFLGALVLPKLSFPQDKDSFGINKNKDIKLELAKNENSGLDPIKAEILKQTKKQAQEMNELSNELYTNASLNKEMQKLVDVDLPANVRPSIWPVLGIITSPFGWRHVGGRLEFHPGVDIAANYGTPIDVTAKGRVVYVGWIDGYGITVIVYHGYGYTTLYAHMARALVRIGEDVEKGQVIGLIGMTGFATGPHVHYEVAKYGVRQDPMAFLP